MPLYAFVGWCLDIEVNLHSTHIELLYCLCFGSSLEKNLNSIVTYVAIHAPQAMLCLDLERESKARRCISSSAVLEYFLSIVSENEVRVS